MAATLTQNTIGKAGESGATGPQDEVAYLSRRGYEVEPLPLGSDGVQRWRVIPPGGAWEDRGYHERQDLLELVRIVREGDQPAAAAAQGVNRVKKTDGPILKPSEAAGGKGAKKGSRKGAREPEADEPEAPAPEAAPDAPEAAKGAPKKGAPKKGAPKKGAGEGPARNEALLNDPAVNVVPRGGADYVQAPPSKAEVEREQRKNAPPEEAPKEASKKGAAKKGAASKKGASKKGGGGKGGAATDALLAKVAKYTKDKPLLRTDLDTLADKMLILDLARRGLVGKVKLEGNRSGFYPLPAKKS